MCFPQTVQRELILLTAERFQLPADLIVQMERVAHDRKGNIMLMKQLQQTPEIRMEDRVSAGQIKIRKSAIYLTEVKTVVEGFLHLFPCHAVQFPAGITGEDIAVLAALVAFICYVPLKGKVLFHVIVTLHLLFLS